MSQPVIEIWRPIADCMSAYEVSSLGRVRSLDRIVASSSRENQRLRGRVLKQGLASNGYYTVALSISGKPQSRSVHSLVAAAFVGSRPDGWDIDHIDGDRTNNSPGNLRYVSHKLNTRNVTVVNARSGALGVYPNGSGWSAQIGMDRETLHLGTFSTVSQAAQARKDYERQIDYRGLASRG